MTTVLKKSKMCFFITAYFFHLQKQPMEKMCMHTDLQLYLRLCSKINRTNKNKGFVFSYYTVSVGWARAFPRVSLKEYQELFV